MQTCDMYGAQEMYGFGWSFGARTCKHVACVEQGIYWFKWSQPKPLIILLHLCLPQEAHLVEWLFCKQYVRGLNLT